MMSFSSFLWISLIMHSLIGSERASNLIASFRTSRRGWMRHSLKVEKNSAGRPSLPGDFLPLSWLIAFEISSTVRSRSNHLEWWKIDFFYKLLHQVDCYFLFYPFVIEQILEELCADANSPQAYRGRIWWNSLKTDTWSVDNLESYNLVNTITIQGTLYL